MAKKQFADYMKEKKMREPEGKRELAQTLKTYILCRSKKERIHSMYKKTIIRFGFLISRIIKVSVRVISLSRRLRLITPDNPLITSTLIIVDIAKTSSNNCLIFPSKGDDYSREATNSGTAIIRGSTVCCVYIRREKCQSEKTQDHL